MKPNAWMRKWAFDGEKPVKTKNANGRLSWGKYRWLPVTENKVHHDDIPLFAILELSASEISALSAVAPSADAKEGGDE